MDRFKYKRTRSSAALNVITCGANAKFTFYRHINRPTLTHSVANDKKMHCSIFGNYLNIIGTVLDCFQY